MGLFDWLGGGSGEETILCECCKCGTRYVLGVNAAAVTFITSMRFLALLGDNPSAKPSTLRKLEAEADRHEGPVPRQVDPDDIALYAGCESWPEDKPVPLRKRSIPDEIIRAEEESVPRRWRCKGCGEVQPYPWSDPKNDAPSARQGSAPEPDSGAAAQAKIRFPCPHCGKRVGVALHLAGRRAKCPGCSTLFKIPDADE